MRIKMVTLVIFISLLLAGCVHMENTSELGIENNKVYGYQVTEKDGITVGINGVKYVTLPETKWVGQQIGEIFGYAGQEKKGLYLVENDEARNFVFIYDSALCPAGDTHDILLYKEGLAKPSAESVDELHWVEYQNINGELEYSYDNTITDKRIINELFYEFTTKEKVQGVSFFNNDNKLRIMYISCYSNDIGGAYYDLDIKHYEGNIVCGNNMEGYVNIPVELIEKIAGRKLQVEEFLIDS